MFGKNKVEKQALTDGATLEIKEIFDTIQGEGPYAGEPAVFIRLGKCNLRCTWCDTDFESDLKTMTVDQVVQQVEAVRLSKRTTLVVLTGGEPLRQNIIPLMTALNAQGFRCQIETSGSLWLPELHLLLSPLYKTPLLNTMVVSPKTPGLAAEVPKYATAWKYVVGADDWSPVDGLPRLNPQSQAAPGVARPSGIACRNVFIQPRDDYDATKNRENQRVATQICRQFGYRLSLQLHKLVGVP